MEEHKNDLGQLTTRQLLARRRALCERAEAEDLPAST